MPQRIVQSQQIINNPFPFPFIHGHMKYYYKNGVSMHRIFSKDQSWKCFNIFLYIEDKKFKSRLLIGVKKYALLMNPHLFQ